MNRCEFVQEPASGIAGLGIGPQSVPIHVQPYNIGVKRILLVLLTLLPLVLTATPSSAAVKAGSACTKQGAKQISGGKSYTCIKQGKKFVWNKGVSVKKPTPAAATTPVATPTPALTPAASTPAPAPTKVGYTMAQVRANNSASSCWSVIDGSVYNLTKWINSHPGGAAVMVGLCGRDGTSSFNSRHGGQSSPKSTLTSYLLGPLEK
jgi:hypothetical protein